MTSAFYAEIRGRLAYVVELYDKLADRYDEVYGDEQRRKYELIGAVTCGRILDLGCGTGTWQNLLNPSHYVGLDVSYGMAKAVAKRDLDVVVGEIHLLPIRDGAFDFVTAITVIDVGSYDVGRVLSEALRVGECFVYTLVVKGEEIFQVDCKEKLSV